jgi:hypothetical protein
MDARVFDHEQAIKALMAERYLLGELAESERDAYEEHLFQCAVCFEQVKAGTEFVSYLNRFGAESTPSESDPAPHPGFFKGLRHPAAVLALSLLVCMSGIGVYQASVISRQKEPGLELRSVLTGIAHGGESAKVIRVSRSANISVAVEYTLRDELTAYGVRILSDSSKVNYNLPIPGNQVDGMASIAIPPGSLGAGRYSVIVWGRNHDGVEIEVGRFAFELQFTD